MKRSKLRLEHVVLAIVLTGLGGAPVPTGAYELRGHVKPQLLVADLPSDSLLQEFSDDPMQDIGLDLRANLTGGAGAWDWAADYQLLARKGDQLELLQVNAFPGFAAPIADDHNRVFDLTRQISEGDDYVMTSRLDRLYAAYSTDRSVVKAGRQAISWGNGLFYNPVDFFNPFDPAAIDTEYKTGDDMLYAQYLFDSGDDLQAVWVGRRDDDGHITADVTSLATKYHVFSGTRELDLLAARHYGETVVAIGGIVDVTGAIWRSDLMLTDTPGGNVTSGVLNWSYSLLAWRKNMTATVEYFHSGFGIDDGDYSPGALAARPELTERLRRGELFTLAQNYLAAALGVEMTPLWMFTASVFHNLDDNSMMLQLFSQHDLQQDLQLLLALNLPRGDEGTEFGGIDSGIDGRPLSIGASAFAQLAWYF